MNSPDNFIQHKVYASLYAMLFLVSLLALSLLLEGCDDTCKTTRKYSYYEPKYTPLSEIRNGIKLQQVQPISKVGKIYIKGHLLFVNDPGKGIHIIDNQNPASPVRKSFLAIPGNYELAVKGNVLYADSYMDLVA